LLTSLSREARMALLQFFGTGIITSCLSLMITSLLYTNRQKSQFSFKIKFSSPEDYGRKHLENRLVDDLRYKPKISTYL